MNWRRLFGRALACGLLIASAAFSGRCLGAEPIRRHRDVVYCQRDDRALTADLYQPSGDGPFPGVLVVHGGAWAGGSKGQLSFVARQLARHGFLAVAINYRLAPKHKFPAQLEDCHAAVVWMRRQAAEYRLDPKRIGGFGYSAGGHLVALQAARAGAELLKGGKSPDPDNDGRLQAVVAGGAPCDFRSIPPGMGVLSYWLGGTRAESPEAYKLASPAEYVSGHMPPTFFFHGDGDTLVRLADPESMSESLRELNVATEFHIVKNKGHVLAMFDQQALDAAIRFLTRHLRDGK